MISLIRSPLYFQVQYHNITWGRSELFFHSIFYLSLATSLRNMFQEYFPHFSYRNIVFWYLPPQPFFPVNLKKSNIIFISLLFFYHMLYLSITNRYVTKKTLNLEKSLDCLSSKVVKFRRLN